MKTYEIYRTIDNVTVMVIVADTMVRANDDPPGNIFIGDTNMGLARVNDRMGYAITEKDKRSQS
jgi:hypothetical protein